MIIGLMMAPSVLFEVVNMYWTFITLLKSSHMFKKHWEKYPSCIIVLLFMMDITMCGFYFSFDSIVHYDDALVDQLLILYNPPSFINLLGSIGYYLFGLFLILMD